MVVFFLKISVVMLSLFSLIDASATELIVTKRPTTMIDLRIISAEWGDFDGFSLKSDNGISHHLQCYNNPFYNERVSRLEYKNIYGVPVGWFRIEDQICLRLFDFLRATFEAIDQDNPIWMRLETGTLSVSKIQLPSLDPYNDDAKSPESKDLNLTSLSY